MFSRGLKDGLAIGLGYLSVGFTFGIAAVGAGIQWWEALLISMTNLTSSGQFAGISVIAGFGSYMEMALTQFIINMRYSLMGISLSQKLDSRFTTKYKLLLGFFNTDEIFAVSVSREGEVSRSYYLGLAVLPYIGWTGGTLAGAVSGNILPEVAANALGIAIYGMFLAIIVPAAKKDLKIFRVVLIAAVLSSTLYFIPLFDKITSGFSIIICTIISSLVGAIFFPIDEEGENTKALNEDVDIDGLMKEPHTGKVTDDEQ